MIKVTKDGVTFSKELSDKGIYRSRGFGSVDHQEIARGFVDKSLECVSIIVICERLRTEHWGNAKYMHMEHEVGVSDMQEAIRKELQCKYPTLEEIKKLIRQKKFPTKATNWDRSDAGKKRDFKYASELENAIYSAYEFALFPSHIMAQRFEFDESFREEFPQATKEEMKTAWRKELLSMLLPKVSARSERLYEMPNPLNHWDDRNKWQQFYFVDRGEKIEYAIGGSGSSGRREAHGRFGHSFAALASKHGINAPTYIYSYDCDNQFKLKKSYEGFKVMHQDLSGNYQVDFSKTKHLFKNRLLSIDPDGTLRDVE